MPMTKEELLGKSEDWLWLALSRERRGDTDAAESCLRLAISYEAEANAIAEENRLLEIERNLE